MFVLPFGLNWLLAAALTRLDGRKRWVTWTAIIGLMVSTAALFWVGVNVFRSGELVMVAGGWPRGVGITLRVDALGITFAVLVNLLLVFALLYENIVHFAQPEFPALVMFLAAGLTGLCITGDAFDFYVFFEVSMTASYIIASYGQSPRVVRGSLIFLVVNLLGSVIFLSGIVGLYRLTGTLDMHQIAVRLQQIHLDPNVHTQVLMIATLIFSAFSLKLGLFPFHFWLPGVYRGVRPVSAAILGGVLANIGSYGLLRFGGEILRSELDAVKIPLFIIGSLSILYGGFIAVSRRQDRETLAYSSISQVGYVVIALAISGTAGIAAAVIYAVINALNETLVFAVAGLRGRLVGAAFAIAGFSVAGVPPAAGFIAKAAVFRAAIGSPGLVTIILLGGALSLVYMFQAFQQAFWVQKQNGTDPYNVRFLVLLLAVMLIILGIFPGFLLNIGQHVAQVLILEAP